MTFQVGGVDDFLRLSKALKNAGRGELRKALNKGLREAAKPLIPKTRESALSGLPRRGGLARQVAKTPQRVQVRTGRDPGVRIAVSNSRSGARAANRGVIRHPVFGHRDRFVAQQVQPGWFDRPLLEAAKDVLPELERVLERVAQQVVDEARGR